MTEFEEIFERIKGATGTRTQVELAQVLDIRQSSISDAKRRNSVPAEWFLKLFDRYGLNPDWLKKEQGPMYLRSDAGYGPVDAEPGLAQESNAKYNRGELNSTVVNVLSCFTSTTPGASDHPVVGKIALPQSFVSRGTMVLLNETTSMDPIITKGAYVGIDTTQKRVSSSEIYAATLPYEGIVLKRALIDSQAGKIVLQSSNPAHPDFSVAIEKYEEFIVGRLAWVLQRY